MKAFSFLIIIAFFFASCSKTEVDLLVHNAKIYTVDDQFSTAEAFAIKDGKFFEVGSNKELLKRYTSQQIFDASGACIYPGFADAHCHFMGYAKGLQTADLRGTKSFEEVIDVIKAHAIKFPGDWIIGRGWDQNDWENAVFPDKRMLDALFPDKAVVLTRVAGHSVLANSLAIEKSGINIFEYPDELVLKENGRLTGMFLESAADDIKSKIPDVDGSTLETLLEEAQRKCLAVGLTSVNDAGIDVEDYSLLEKLSSNQRLKINVDAWINHDEKNLDLIKKGPDYEGNIVLTSIKLYADGALGSRGACLLEPYSDKNTSGVIIHDYDFYKKWCKVAYEYNFQVATHCIGDSANRIMLNIYGSFLKGENDRRWRIEHAQVIDPNDFKKFDQFDIIPSIQTTHATSDMYWAGKRLGNRVVNAYAYQKLLKQNGWLPNGSDFPVEQINPLFGFYAAVARKDQQNWPEKGFQKDNALTREQALRAMTIWASKANFTDGLKGSIEAGKKADFVVLDTDLMSELEEKLYNAKVKSTFISGEKVFESN